MPDYYSGRSHAPSFTGNVRSEPHVHYNEKEHQKLLEEFGKRAKLNDKETKVEDKQQVKKAKHTPVQEIKSIEPEEQEQEQTSSLFSKNERSTTLGEQAYNQKDYATAYNLFSEVVSQQPNNHRARFHLSVSATETGNHTVAIQHTQQLIDSGHFTAQAFYFQGRSLEQLGRQSEAAVAYQQAGAEIPEAKAAFMRLEEERLFGGFSNANSQTGQMPHRPAKQDWQRQSVAWKPFSRDRVSSKIASSEDRGVTKHKSSKPEKLAATSPKFSKPSKSSRSVREDTTFNQHARGISSGDPSISAHQSGRPSNYSREDTTSKQNKPSGSRRKDTTSNQSSKPRSSFNFRGKDIAPTILVKQNKTTTQLDVSKLVPVEKLSEAVKRSGKYLEDEVAEELRAIFTPATLATMVAVFAAYIAAHATGIGQAMDIGMLIAGGIFFGLDAFTIFKDIAGFAGAINATTEEELDQAGKNLAGAVAKIGVDVVMTLLTKKVADRVSGADKAETDLVESDLSRGNIQIKPLGGRSSIPVDPSDPMYMFGTHKGQSSGRNFNPDKLGLPISSKPLSSDKIKITEIGLDMVKKHMNSFDPDPQNQKQIQRFESILSGEIKPSKRDLDTYAHELRESLRYKRIGYTNGNNPDLDYEVWNDNHTGTLEDYNLTDNDMYDLSTFED